MRAGSLIIWKEADVTSPVVGRLEEPQVWWSAGARPLDVLVCGVPPQVGLGSHIYFFLNSQPLGPELVELVVRSAE